MSNLVAEPVEVKNAMAHIKSLQVPDDYSVFETMHFSSWSLLLVVQGFSCYTFSPFEKGGLRGIFF